MVLNNDKKNRRAAVRAANKLRQPLSLLKPAESESLLHLTTPEGQAITFSSAKYSELDQRTQTWIMALWERNMKKMMRASHWGFDPVDKEAELSASTSRYLIASIPDQKGEEGEPKLLAYCHYRFDVDEACPVVYCYELQAEAEYQRRGLCRRFVQLLILFAQRTKMAKVMATVLYSNEGSEIFFRKLGFELDFTDPGSEFADYMILSRNCTSSK